MKKYKTTKIENIIAFDVMGSDLGPKVAIEAAVASTKKFSNLKLLLFGQENLINLELKKYEYNPNQIEIINCDEVISMTDGILEIRRKINSSMVKAIEAVRDNIAQGVITASSTASYVAGCYFILNKLPTIPKLAFMPIIPTIIKNKISLLLDVGANIECSGDDIYNFARMANSYAKSNYNVASPKIGLLNIGEEPTKGTEFLKEAWKLLENDKNLNFYGNIESREITSGICDVLVIDGYAGNIALKSFEGMGRNLLDTIKTEIKKNLWRKIIYIIGFRRAFNSVRKLFDYKNYAGAIVLGVNGIAFKSHGSSDLQCFNATIRMTYEAIKNNTLEKMKKDLNL